VEDNTPPVISYVDNQIVAADNPNGYTVQGTEFDIPSMSDNCGIASVVNNFNNQATLDGALLPVGVTNITWTVTDTAGNETLNNFYVEVTPYVGIDDLRHDGIKVYPNPFDEQINLKARNVDIQKIILLDIAGKIIWMSNKKKGNISIDTKTLKAGMYFLHINTDAAIYTLKMIKE